MITKKRFFHQWPLDTLGVLLFPFLLPLPIPLNIKSIALIIFFLVLVLNLRKENAPVKSILSQKLFLVCMVLFLLDPIFSFFRGDSLYLNDVRLSFLVAPALFFVNRNFLMAHKFKILNAFIFGVFIYIFYACIYVVLFYWKYSDHYTLEINYYLKYVFYHHLPGAIHHTYLGIFLVFTGLLILTYKKSLSHLQRWAIVLPLFILNFVMGSKLSIVMFCLIIAMVMFHNSRIKPKTYITALISFLLVISFLFYTIYFKTDLFRTLNNSFTNRIELLKCSFEQIENNFLIGIGNYNIKNELLKCSEHGSVAMDTHNMFVQEFLANGVFGFIAVGVLIFLLFKKSKNDFILFLFTVVFFLAGMVEHILNLQLGVTFFLFFSMLFFYTKKEQLP